MLPMNSFVPPPVQAYLAGLTRLGDSAADQVRRRSVADHVPAVGPETGALLHVLAAGAGASRVLEIGTGYGYSAIWLARALPAGGLLITIEQDAARAAVAKEHFALAGVSDRANVLVGDAAIRIAKVAGPFDLIFQDGDKALYEPLLDRLVPLLRPGGLLVTDNVLWSGDVVPGFAEHLVHDRESVDAIARYNERLAADPRLRTVFLPVGDGVAVAVRV
jgi:predicted O-methyltransferase YrrM